MREIKFRAWDGELMHDVGELHFSQGPKLDGKGIRFYGPGVGSGWVDGENVALMQYTGLKDKNNTEIYEGDIVEQTYHVPYGNPHEGSEGSYDGHHTGEVVITSRGVCMRNPLHYSMDNDETKLVKAYKQLAGYRTKIIGNIYEHPHLLEGGEA
ncbi:YopX family protein [Paenibacillus amylolyticus]|uniref:YopX family protein n=1 Tax=Paenibacillus amylolyticus TaxID=1451 RepID=UPI00096FDCF1|nr:YopX family protein [Paenibacillus amylolyticus]OMF47732.1 hypothetical protein BK136_02235 [Paenibacillus amylolyticus]